MDHSAPALGVEQLDTAIRRLEAALASRPAPTGDGDLRARYDALVAQVEGALKGLDQLLGGML